MTNHFSIITKFLSNNEYISVKQACKLGVGRHVLAEFTKQGKLNRVKRGVYSLPDEFIDEYELLQAKRSKVVYSYNTALFLHGLSDRTPQKIHISVPQGYNVNRLKNNRNILKVHYVKNTLFSLGIEEVTSPQGGKVNVYNKERCICDIIKDKKNMDIQIYQDAIKMYFKSDRKDLRKLIKYSKVLNVEAKVRNYIEVLT
ncbi:MULTISPECIES: abortive infection protein [unclassified Breznakia]|uniref:type IV toxin-antitoxin system AbiEi family antitoxin domain-containing protein n=1 Tax=unclassified Breznakia TaxID=2623764 RepID=UPI002476D076|nr:MULTISPECIES: abortive infection protein [unclassified Breznakia]MDH6367609.1 putative transcriptional regulator of viral defense system [Breznakia sp. PH1-1]MDH6405304.1 putative transcriptional regulator of viral defense system [Breznakia sp. PF1-11]MDH6412439.1 putative transcriptional regulator of viral defense system [Breznakia sp. PFB1-11]MDH6415381.1 putative transcriptional regulator of viral defense system [Breznakia sp. PFB1-14]MDH6417110.1 putative transcriptional regulator of vi